MNVFFVVSWLIFSFLFWRALRHYAVDEDRVFDLTFYATIVTLISARLGFYVVNQSAFAGKSFLLVAAIWVLPGLSWFSGLVGGLCTLIFLSRHFKVRLGLVLDALAIAIPVPITIGHIGFFVESRNSIVLYESIATLFIGFIIYRMTRLSMKRKWPYGIVGMWFFLFYAVLEFALEFFKVSRVYWGNLTANQWVLIGIFAECVGVLYIRGGGREIMRPVGSKIRKVFHEFISRRNAHRTQNPS